MEIIKINEIIEKQYGTNAEYMKLSGADGKELCKIIQTKEDPILRCIAFVALLCHEVDFFRKIPFSEKLTMVEPFFDINATVYNEKECTQTSIITHLAINYVKHLSEEKELVSFALIVQGKSKVIFQAILNSLCLKLQRSEDAHTFFRQITMKENNTVAAQKLANFKREEDVSILSYFLLGNKCRLPRALCQFTNCDFHCDYAPIYVWHWVSKRKKRNETKEKTERERREEEGERNEGKERDNKTVRNRIELTKIFRYFTEYSKIHCRAVCKTWFNQFNNEEEWEKICQKLKFDQIPKFSWMQSYFLQVKKIVRKKAEYYELCNASSFNHQTATEIILAFPHRDFIYIPLFWYPATSRAAIEPLLKAIASVSEEHLMDFMKLSSYVNPIVYHTIILEKRWQANPKVASFFLKYFIHILSRLRVETLEMLIQNYKTELYEKISNLVNPNLGYINEQQSSFIFVLHNQGECFPQVLEIILNDEEMFKNFIKSLVAISDDLWYGEEFIPKIFSSLRGRDQEVVEVLSNRLQTTNHIVILSQCITFLGKFPSGIPALLEFKTAHPTNKQYHSMVDESIEEGKIERKKKGTEKNTNKKSNCSIS